MRMTVYRGDCECVQLPTCVDDRARNAMQDILDTHRAAVEQDAVNAKDLDEKYSSLNINQKCVVDKVVEKLKNGDVIHLIVSGQGGTGKSRVIEVLNSTLDGPLQGGPYKLTLVDSH